MSRRSLEAHLCVCEYSSRVCASGCGYTVLNTEETQHNCVSELRAELDMLRYHRILPRLAADVMLGNKWVTMCVML